MGDSTLETQIDCFLEQFKRSASKAMEDRLSIGRSRSSYIEDECLNDESMPVCEEIEMQNTVQLEPLGINDVEYLLHPQYAIITGGKSKEGCPIITFPDNNNFHTLSDVEYQQLILYLTSVPSLQEADLGFHLIVDRRKDRWNSVKAVLLKISVYFPGLIHVVYVLRPASFIQKALSEVSNKLFKDEFKFRMIVLSTLEELHEHIALNQLTKDLGGTLHYSHKDWILQRIHLEQFSDITQQVSVALDEFTKNIDEAELPNTVETTNNLLSQQSRIYSDLKNEISIATNHGENLLQTIKENVISDSTTNGQSVDTGNVFAVERLLVQLEETEKTFDDFWEKHSRKLQHCLELRKFEQNFRELRVNFDSHLKIVTEMTSTADNAHQLETLVKETREFEVFCLADIEKAEEVITSGRNLLTIKNSCPLECVEPKCNELIRMRELLLEKLEERMNNLMKCKEFIEKVEKANKWCATGIDLLASQKIEKNNISIELAEKYLADVDEFLKSADEFVSNGTQTTIFSIFKQTILPHNKACATQVLQRVEDVHTMCEKRTAFLKKIIGKQQKQISAVLEISVPKQPLGGAPHPGKFVSKKMESNPLSEDNNIPETEELIEINKVKRGHVLTELIDTERVYVMELQSIITGYKDQSHADDMQHLISPGFHDKLEIIFGNLDEIYNFHCNVFLKDLEYSITSPDAVAMCFVEKKDGFFRLYSYYCQNIPKSEQLRETLVDSNMFFQICQKKLGHKLPLAAYLLKPVQRITKYQLLLKDLLRYSEDGKNNTMLQQALDCMLLVLKCVNDSMHQISITGFPSDLSQQGELLLQGEFSVWSENKRDIRLRLKPTRRHIFLYQKVLLFCKPAPKTSHNKATYQFKQHLQLSQIGLTESVKGDSRKFEIWLQGRAEVHTIQAANIDQKQQWVNKIKRVLLDQLEELKGEKIKQYSQSYHRPLRQTTSWERQKPSNNISLVNNKALSVTSEHPPNLVDDGVECHENENWSSDCSNSEDEEHPGNPLIQWSGVAKPVGQSTVDRVVQYFVGSTTNTSTFYVSHY